MMTVQCVNFYITHLFKLYKGLKLCIIRGVVTLSWGIFHANIGQMVWLAVQLFVLTDLSKGTDAGVTISGGQSCGRYLEFQSNKHPESRRTHSLFF